jgi:large subunit ribosomal protein L30
MADKKLKITLVRSRSRADKFQRMSLIGLNLKKTNHFSVLEDTPSIRGMIAKVHHLVSVEEI